MFNTRARSCEQRRFLPCTNSPLPASDESRLADFPPVLPCMRFSGTLRQHREPFPLFHLLPPDCRTEGRLVGTVALTAAVVPAENWEKTGRLLLSVHESTQVQTHKHTHAHTWIQRHGSESLPWLPGNRCRVPHVYFKGSLC